MTNPEQPDSSSALRVLSSGMRRATNNQILVGVASLADSILLPPIMSNAIESVHHALATPQNSVATLDLNSLRGILDTSASQSYLSHLYNQPIGIILSELHALTMGINFPDDTIDKHPNKMLKNLAKWHNFWHSSPTADTPSSHVIETLRAIPKTAALLLTLSTSYTAELVFPTLLCLVSGAEVDHSAYLPAFLALLSGGIALYDLAIISASILQHVHPLPEPEPSPLNNQPPSLPILVTPPSLPPKHSTNLITRIVKILTNPSSSEPIEPSAHSALREPPSSTNHKKLDSPKIDQKKLPGS